MKDLLTNNGSIHAKIEFLFYAIPNKLMQVKQILFESFVKAYEMSIRNDGITCGRWKN